MRKYLAGLTITGLIAVAMPSTAMAGGALAGELFPTLDAIDCSVFDPCESNGSGSTATLKIKGVNNMSFIMDGMLPGTMYHVTLNGGGACGMADEVAMFSSTASGTVNITENLAVAPELGDLVEVCRVDDALGAIVIYNGTLGRLNGR